MKLRKLTLHNVRRFAGRTAHIGPFADGLTTITAPNESGKSTFFAALHALIFYDYGSGRKELKQMQPYSGGAMRIAAEVEIAGETYGVEKVFNLKKAGSSATITAFPAGHILKQADDAEQWIQQTILSGNTGPFGLLWVRQSDTGMDTGPDGITARRDIMSSVRGQIDSITGGRHMDAIIARCEADLDALATKQGRPKAGSPWKEAEDRAEQLRAQKDKLAGQVRALGEDLSLKQQAAKRLRDLNDPELTQRRASEIEQSNAQLTTAREHARQLSDAEKDIALLETRQRDALRDISVITQAQDERTRLAAQIKEQQETRASATSARAQAQSAVTHRQDEIAQCDAERRSLIEQLAEARLDEKRRDSRKRLAVLTDLQRQLHAPQDALQRAEAVLKAPEVSKPRLDALADLERRRDIAIQMRRAHFSSATFQSDTDLAHMGGAQIPNGAAQLIDRPLEITLPGFGTVSLRPAVEAGQGIEDPDALQSDLRADLAALGFERLKDAREAYDQRQLAQRDKQTAQTQIRTIAPDGVAALQSEIAELSQTRGSSAASQGLAGPDPASGDSPPETEATARSTAQLEQQISALEDTLARLRNGQQALQDAVTSASNKATTAEVLLTRLRADEEALAPQPRETERQAELRGVLEAATQELATATRARDTARAAAPDLEAAIAAHDRAVQAQEQDKEEIQKLERELARLDGAIQTRSESAVEEKLSEISGQLARAENRAAQFETHVKALEFLLAQLQSARADAQETYFEPVRAELIPLLRQLHSGADFQIDADKLLIGTVTRDGITDPVSSLSGGASEQIAILTRLAFARLFAKHGNHVPIILDDAMVHTDDDRIATMFNMLARIARDQQIIVLSCRTRAFSDLGGDRGYIVQAPRDEGYLN